jgi:hypothetical protein
MKNGIRIIAIVALLLGGVTSFGYWAMGQFDQAFDTLDSSLASTQAAYEAFRTQVEKQASATLATTLETASTTPGVAATSTPPSLSFTFPKSNTNVYIGCTYGISWESSVAVSSLEAALIDSGTKMATGSSTSGLAKEHSIKEKVGGLSWKVGPLTPGVYYLKVSKVNSIPVEIRSKVFTISKTPEDLSAEERKGVCEASNRLI